MNSRQQENRRTAAREFMRSLAELETVLQASGPSPPSAETSPSAQASATAEDFDWETALDEAAQDIEQFMTEPSTEPSTESNGGT